MTKEEFDIRHKKFIEVLNKIYPEDSEEPREEYMKEPFYMKSDFIELFEPKITDEIEEEPKTKYFTKDVIEKITDPEEIMLLPIMEKLFSNCINSFEKEMEAIDRGEEFYKELEEEIR
jgi:hypothetical protein